MKKNLPLRLLTLIFCVLSPIASAKSDADWKEFKKAAEEYEAMSKKYEAMAEKALATEPEKASLYKKVAENFEDMADIKDDAARMAKRGKWGNISWDKYEKMAKENQEYLKLIDKTDQGKDASSKSDKMKKEYSKDKDEMTKKRIKELEHQLEMERKKLEKSDD